MSTTTETVVSTDQFELQVLPKTTRAQSVHSSKTYIEPASNSIGNSDAESPTAKESQQRFNLRTYLTIFTPAFAGFLASFTNGLITVGLPTIARDITLERSLYLWPSSVYGLTSGAALLIAGSIADIVGAKPVELAGITLLGLTALASGLAISGAQLVAFRAIQGIALAMHLPASVSIITGAVPSGKARNVGFACLGFGTTMGFAFGLVLNGVIIERAGWRMGFYVSGGCTLALAIAAIWTLPSLKTSQKIGAAATFKKVCREIDWIGGLISSSGLALLAYVLAILSADLTSIHSPLTATLLALGLLLVLAFPAWMHHRTSRSLPALVPNALWTNSHFTATCIMVALTVGVINSIELFSSLYFQEIQHASTLATSLYLLPNLTTAVLINVFIGFFVHRVSARWLIGGSTLICALSPMFMALMHPGWRYWYLAFWAQIFAPFSADVLLTVGLIIVSDSFPEETQALAGAVFNTVAQFGMSLGMGSCQVVALGVQGRSSGGEHGGGGAFEENDTGALLEGYRASFWLMFGYMIVCGGIAIVGLRKAGKVGLKRE